MARAVTLTQLLTDARLYADQRPGGSSAYINDTELTRLVNMKLAELYDILIAARGQDYYVSSTTLSIVANTATYNLPSDFYQLLSLTLEWATDDHETVDAVNSLNERAWYANAATWGNGERKGYRLRNTTIEFLPTPKSAVTARMQYIPAFTDLSGVQTFDGVNGWEKLVTLGVAIEMRVIRKDPYGDLAALYQEQRQRIDALAADRAVEAPKRVVDVSPERGLDWMPRGRARVL